MYGKVVDSGTLAAMMAWSNGASDGKLLFDRGLTEPYWG
jgi:hypothetical protein